MWHLSGRTKIFIALLMNSKPSFQAPIQWYCVSYLRRYKCRYSLISSFVSLTFWGPYLKCEAIAHKTAKVLTVITILIVSGLRVNRQFLHLLPLGSIIRPNSLADVIMELPLLKNPLCISRLLIHWSVFHFHYGDVIMDAIASQITSLAIVYSIVYSDADQRKHQSSASLAFVRGILRTNGQ